MDIQLNVALEQIKTKIEKITDRSKYNEEQTKTALIMPMFMALGYDVFDADEFIPEYTADIGMKVDYAICINGQPIILIEANKLGLSLEKEQVSQLLSYYVNTTAKIFILTNGDDYWFFNNTNRLNSNDEPYLKVKVTDINGLANKLEIYKRDNIEGFNFSEHIQIEKVEDAVNTFIYSLETANYIESFINYIGSLANAESLDKSKIAEIFTKEFSKRFNKENIRDKNDKIEALENKQYTRDDIKDKIISMWNSGKSGMDIARELNINSAAVYSCIYGNKDKITRTSRERGSFKQYSDFKVTTDIDCSKYYGIKDILWESHTPYSTKLDDTEYNTKSIADILILVVTYLWLKYPDKRDILLSYNGYEKNISKEPINRGAPKYISQIGLYVQTQVNSPTKQRFIIELLNKYGLDDILSVKFVK